MRVKRDFREQRAESTHPGNLILLQLTWLPWQPWGAGGASSSPFDQQESIMYEGGSERTHCGPCSFTLTRVLATVP